jgi:hypothetical protein
MVPFGHIYNACGDKEGSQEDGRMKKRGSGEDKKKGKLGEKT